MTIAAEKLKSADAFDVQPALGSDEFTIGGGSELDVSRIGGYPVRLFEVVSGTGTIKYRDGVDQATNRTFTAVAVGNRLGPTQITSIRGTGDGSNAITIRVYK